MKSRHCLRQASYHSLMLGPSRHSSTHQHTASYSSTRSYSNQHRVALHTELKQSNQAMKEICDTERMNVLTSFGSSSSSRMLGRNQFSSELPRADFVRNHDWSCCVLRATWGAGRKNLLGSLACEFLGLRHCLQFECGGSAL